MKTNMTKKLGSIIIALIITGATALTTFAAIPNEILVSNIPNGSVLIGNKAFSLAYANDVVNLSEINDTIVAGGKIYVKDFSGNWIDNLTGEIVGRPNVTEITYVDNTVPIVTPPVVKRDAGNFVTSSSKLVTIDKSASYDTNISKINGMIGNTYGLRYVPTMTKSGTDSGYATFKYNTATNSYGLEVFGWRDSYDSNMSENNALNAVLETLYAMCGDKQVAKAIWNFLDDAGINGSSNTNNFGFKDVSSSGNHGIVTMNGITLDITVGNGTNTIYFK